MSDIGKLPVILFLKNRKPYIFQAEIERIQRPQDFDDQVLDQLPNGIERRDVIKITCFCSICQSEFSMDLNVALSRVHQMMEEFPPEVLLAYMTGLPQDYSALTRGWMFFAPLLQAIEAMRPFMLDAAKKAKEWQETNT